MAQRPHATASTRPSARAAQKVSRRMAVIGAGMAGITCARTLLQAGHDVSVFESAPLPGGRMASVDTPFGTFDTGAQYFTVRDPRFEQALATSPQAIRRWSANAVRILDEHGQLASNSLPHPEAHWVGTPAMNRLLRAWAAPLDDTHRLQCHSTVTAIERDALDSSRWQLQTHTPDNGQQVHAGFDAVLLALPAPQAGALLAATPGAAALVQATAQTTTAPCWTLLLAFPQAMQPGLTTLGPQWNAAFSTHHRIAWLARESSKPGRRQIERWTVQASPEWSAEHLHDDPERVQAKLHRAFTDITGIHAEPPYMAVHRWPYAKTLQALGQTHVLDDTNGLGLCGDWCLGHRVEDAFVSGLSLALALA